VKLDVELLAEEAGARTGLSDWGDDTSFWTGLGRLVADTNDVPRPAPLVEKVSERLVDLLCTRLRLAADERENPELADAPIERPVILIGMARTGTTILHDLLALDPAARAPLQWETANPWPAPERETFDVDPRIARTAAAQEEMLAAAPALRAMHPFSPTDPADCLDLLTLHFACARFWSWYGLDGYAEWLASAPAEGVYRTHARVLRQLQWKGPRGRWTLKEPTHQLNLDQLAAAYPDACLVQTHRDPVRTFPSAASLNHTVQSILNPGQDPRATGRTARVLFGACLDRSVAARDADPELDARVLDVSYAETVTDPVGQVQRIHEHFDLPFSEEHAQRIEKHLAAGTDAARGLHRYRAEDYGLDLDELRSAHPRYRQRFGHLLAEPERT
jgi:hypothetical protein